MRLRFHLHRRELSDLSTVIFMESFALEGARSTVSNWVQTGRVQPTGSNPSDHVAVDETGIQLSDGHYWAIVAVDPPTDEFLHVRLSRQGYCPHGNLPRRAQWNPCRRRRRVARRFGRLAERCDPSQIRCVAVRSHGQCNGCQTYILNGRTGKLPALIPFSIATMISMNSWLESFARYWTSRR